MNKCQILILCTPLSLYEKRNAICFDLRKTQKGAALSLYSAIQKGLPYDQGKRDKGAFIFLVAL